MVGGKIVTKPSKEVSEDNEVEILKEPEFVSRGGLKLDGALKLFFIDVKDLVCLDVGASTGGFTDCLLKRGAKKVYAVDVGTAQLANSLKNDPRVVSLENTDIREVKPADFAEKIDLVVCDVSFISLRHIFPAAAALCERGVFLVKPQFELDKKALSKSGVVKDAAKRKKAFESVCGYAKEAGFEVVNSAESPIKGGDGNTEYLIYLEKRR